MFNNPRSSNTLYALYYLMIHLPDNIHNDNVIRDKICWRFFLLFWFVVDNYDEEQGSICYSTYANVTKELDTDKLLLPIPPSFPPSVQGRLRHYFVMVWEHLYGYTFRVKDEYFLIHVIIIIIIILIWVLNFPVSSMDFTNKLIYIYDTQKWNMTILTIRIEKEEKKK